MRKKASMQMATMIDQGRKVGELVVENPNRARVFEARGIDYCCGGKMELDKACARTRNDVAQVIAELAACDASASTAAESFESMPLGELCDHIVAAHHDHTRAELPRLAHLTEKVARVHGERDPRLGALRDVFAVFRIGLEQHMAKEESILFPWIKELDGARIAAEMRGRSVEIPIRCMELEHNEAGDALARFRELTDGYAPPAGACNSWRIMLHGLGELEKDLHTHVHKENNVLFPRALKVEAELAALSRT